MPGTRPGDGAAVDDQVDEHICEDEKTEQREQEADDTRHLEWDRAEPSHHVERVGDQLAEGVRRGTEPAGLVLDRDMSERRGPPRQEHIDRDVRAR